MKLDDKTQYFSHLSIDLLDRLGNYKPSAKQLELMEMLVSKITVDQKLSFDNQLTYQEINCLLFAAKGKTSNQTAKLLGVKRSTIESHRREIKRKLGCNTMAHAVFQGIRFGYVTPLKIN